MTSAARILTLFADVHPPQSCACAVYLNVDGSIVSEGALNIDYTEFRTNWRYGRRLTVHLGPGRPSTLVQSEVAVVYDNDALYDCCRRNPSTADDGLLQPCKQGLLKYDAPTRINQAATAHTQMRLRGLIRQ